jgi:hypothetical protein
MDRDGITVSQREVEGRAMPVFRGVTTIAATPLEILAVIDDYERQCEWMPRCMEIRLIEQLAPNDRFLYSLANAPWPVHDRDVVVRSRFDVIAPGKDIKITFRASPHPSTPPVDGVVRVKQMRSHYHLREASHGRTRVEYEVDSDPGGSVPEWLVAREGKELPLDTLKSLRGQVRKTRGQYQAFVQRWGG